MSHRKPPMPPRSLRSLSCQALLLAALLLCALTGSAGAAQTAAVQTHLLWSDVTPTNVDRQLDQVKSSGAGMVRVDLGWASLEPTGKGQWSAWYLGRIDDIVTKTRARGLRVLFTVWETPCWASRAPETLKAGCTGSWWDRGVQRYGPANPGDYADAVAFLARRYAGRVKAWEIWNEPNSSDYFVSSSPISEYAGLVKAAYAPAKAADPTATIVAGSIMWADAAFVSGLYDNGIKGKFDALSIHPYSDDRSPLSPGSDQWIRGSFIRGVPAVHDAMAARGDDKPLWLTEYGWSTTTTRNADNWLNGVSEATQADFVTEAVVKMATWSYVDVGVYYELRDTGTDPASTIAHFGLTRPDGSEKPAFGAFRDAIARVGGSVPTGSRRAGTRSRTHSCDRRRACARNSARVRARARARVERRAQAGQGEEAAGRRQDARRAASRRIEGSRPGVRARQARDADRRSLRRQGLRARAAHGPRHSAP